MTKFGLGCTLPIMGYLRTGLRTALLPYKQHVDQLKRHSSALLSALGVFLLIGLIYEPTHGDRLHAQETELHRLNALNAELMERNIQLAATVHAMRTDPEMVVHLARKDLGMIRPNEVVYEFSRTDDAY